MSAQPVHEEDPQDPQVILRDLPARERPEFLRQYHAAATAALQDVAQYKKLKQLLHHWSLAVIATNQPGYYEALEQAQAGLGETVPLEDAIAAELARRA
ncbi:DUF6247 family protein [Nonomuraea lactucae]|uniref:DUF6247 family protein n=1 Tax=Nonomuraea lactucae TaxID=2249762 RepID=UPI0013B3738A|nr:DUF6247 family protein [Nonomuraea lactucae]